MPVRKKIDFNKINKKWNKIKTDRLQLLGNEIVVNIIRRTQKGKDKYNKPFIKYSAAYKKQKSKGYGSSKPNLTITQNMLNDITSRNIRNGVRLYFLTSTQLKKAIYNQQNGRKFFGIDPKLKKWIHKKI